MCLQKKSAKFVRAALYPRLRGNLVSTRTLLVRVARRGIFNTKNEGCGILEMWWIGGITMVF